MARPIRAPRAKALIGIPAPTRHKPILEEKLAVVHAHHDVRLVAEVHLDGDGLEERGGLDDDGVLFILREVVRVEEERVGWLAGGRVRCGVEVDPVCDVFGFPDAVEPGGRTEAISARGPCGV